MPTSTEGVVRAPLSLDSPLRLRFQAWMMERFPPSHALFHGLLYASAVLYARSLAGGAPRLGLWDVAGFAAAWSFFLMLRVLDEHKDYADDVQHHPDRVLQRGLVTLPLLARVGVVAALVQLVVSLGTDGGFGAVTMLWLATVAWVLLMAREFFVRTWLRPRLLLYATSHMLVMPFAVLWLAQMGSPTTPVWPGALPFAAVAFLSGFVFEVARKTKAPEDERQGVDSYTQRLGTRGAPLVLLGLLVASGVAMLAALASLPGTRALVPWAGLGVALAVAGAALPLLRFRRTPTTATAKAASMGAALAMLGCYLVFVLVLLAPGVLGW